MPKEETARYLKEKATRETREVFSVLGQETAPGSSTDACGSAIGQHPLQSEYTNSKYSAGSALASRLQPFEKEGVGRVAPGSAVRVQVPMWNFHPQLLQTV